jgi:surfeit locus 1 family protein
VRGRVTSRVLAAHVLGTVAVLAAIGLGLWQLDSWRDHRAAEAVSLAGADPVPLTDVLGPDDVVPGERVGQPVTVSGTWLGDDATVLVEGRPLDGRDGLWVVTPVEVADAEAIPVVRGWVADRDDVPPAPTGPAELGGWLQASEGTGAVDDDPTDDVYPQLRVADLVQRVPDLNLFSAYVVAQDGVGGLPSPGLAEQPEVGPTTGLTNLLYAVEWWAFGLFAALVWRRFVQDSHAEEVPADPVPSGA